MSPGQRVVWLRAHCGPLDRTPAVVLRKTSHRVRVVYGRKIGNGQWVADFASVAPANIEDSTVPDIAEWCPDADERRAILDAVPFPVSK